MHVHVLYMCVLYILLRSLNLNPVFKWSDVISDEAKSFVEVEVEFGFVPTSSSVAMPLRQTFVRKWRHVTTHLVEEQVLAVG